MASTSYAPRNTSPLSSPLSSTSSTFPTSDEASPTASDFPRRASTPSSSAAPTRRSSSPAFPRSQPLRPVASALCMSSMNAPSMPSLSRRKSEEPRPINHMMKPNRGNGKVKLLVSTKKMVRPPLASASSAAALDTDAANAPRSPQNSFELNLSGRELARSE